MTKTAAVSKSVPVPATSKKAVNEKIASSKKAMPLKSKSHPSTGEMVNAAISALKDRKGASLQAIKKYIALTYQLDPKKHSYFIKKYLKSAVEKQTIVQVKGTGASGRFKLYPVKEKVKKPAPKKPTMKTVNKPVIKKATDEKVKEATVVVEKTTTKISKSPSKAKKTGKAPTDVKPKTPKPKNVAVPIIKLV